MIKPIRIELWAFGTNNDPYLAPELRFYFLSGYIYGHPHFDDGARIICTSPIQSYDGIYIITRTGSRYLLGEVDPLYESEYPNAKERLIKNLENIK